MKLVCEKITKRFGSNLALQDVDLTINGGEIRALLGGNGSGKSTLSKILGGALYVTSGKMELNGSIYAPKSPIEAKRAGVVFTSQELSLFDNLTVEENIAICTYSVEKLLKNEKKKTISKVHALLQKYGLEHLASKKVKNLSANEQYLIEFMKAVYQKTDVLIIDEITSALYKEDVEIVERVMNDFKAEGKIILFISHRMPEIMELCDTVTVLRNGNVVATHNTKDVSDAELVSEMTGLDISKVAVAAYESNIQNRETEVLLSVRDMPMPHFDTTLDLDVHAGEIIGVAGLQGHGQADLVRQLFGLDPAAAPKVMLRGQELTLSSPAHAIRNHIAFISGDRTTEGIFEERSIEENVEAVSYMILNQKMDATRVLSEFNVKYQNKNDLIVSLSGGNQQKVVLARWLANEPLVVLADDPTKGIDVQARRDVHKTMVEIAKKGSAVIMVSSDNDELVNLMHLAHYSRLIVMYEGQIVRTLTGSDITIENIAKASVNM